MAKSAEEKVGNGGTKPEEGGARGPSLSLVAADRIRQAIARGEYLPGAKLPAEPELAERISVSRPTLREGLRLLESEGLVVRRQRIGTVVTGRPVVRNALGRNFGIQEMLEASGHEYGVRDAEIRFTTADEKAAAALGLDDGGQVVLLERAITSGAVAAMVTRDYLDLQILEAADAPLTPDVHWYLWLHEHCGVDVAYGIASIAATTASPEVAAKLEIDAGAPLFRLEQIDYTSTGRPVLYAIELHAPEVFDVTVVRSGPYA